MKQGAINKILFTVILPCFLFIIHFVSAASTVDDVYDLPSSLEVGAASNHKIVITASENVDEGDTLSIIFPSDFDLSSISEDDIDISDDGTDLTTYSDCSGTEQVGVTVSGNEITLTVCVGDGGAISSASEIIIEIGTNAAYSGSGTNQIINPDSAATYFAGISGTAGMSGSVPIPIVDNDNGNITAVVDGSDSGSSGGSGGGLGTGSGSDASSSDTTDNTEDTTDTSAEDATNTEDTSSDTTETNTETTTDTSTTDSGDSGSSDASTTDSSTSSESFGGTTASDESSASGTSDISSGSGRGLKTEQETDKDSDSVSGIVSSIDDIDISLLVADEEIELSGDTLAVIPQSKAVLKVVVPDDDIDEVWASVGDDDYQLVNTLTNVYEAQVNIPASDTEFSILVKKNDDSVSVFGGVLDAKASGLVYETINNEKIPVSGAVVTIYGPDSSQQWNGARYGESNPFIVGDDGHFSVYLENGEYQIYVAKSGYDDAKKTITVKNNILATNIELKKRSEDIVGSGDVNEDNKKSSNQADEITGAVAFVKNSVESTMFVVRDISKTVNEIRNEPTVQTAAEVAKPVVVTAAVGSAGVLAGSFNLLAFLRYLFTYPILLLGRKKRQEFGVVYNAYTKIPIDLAIVRLYTQDGKLRRTMVTDKEGRYFFKAQPGKYFLKVVKNGFEFPSKYLSGKKQDGDFLDVYTGGLIEVGEENVIINANIPLDPITGIEKQTVKNLILKRFIRTFQNIIAFSGFILAIGVAFIQPTLFSGGLLIAHMVIFSITKILAKPKIKKGWGVVVAENDGKPVQNAIVRLFEPKYNKLIESVLTDGKGRYAFLVGPNEYFVTINKEGYEPIEIKPIDYSKNKEPKVFAANVSLKKVV
ncbi:PEGA domain-containing protein [Candidatus Parcubacteria bacterium]|nr:MAG: PEGA domain-containing protein [Candidatus Parcubacteria bacterium]